MSVDSASTGDPRLNAVASLKPGDAIADPRGGPRDPRLNAVASLKLFRAVRDDFGVDGDPRLNAVASLKQVQDALLAHSLRVIHGLMPWPH